MAVDNVWDNSDADNDGNVAANWSQNRVPTTGDVAVFDSATTDANCTFSGNITADGDGGMRFDNAYAGTVDAATHDITLGTSGLDCTNGDTAGCTLDLGTGTWTTSGDFDFEDIDTIVNSAATLIANNAGVVIKPTNAIDAWDVQISENASTAGASYLQCLNLTVDVNKTLTTGTIVVVEGLTGTLTLNGTIDNGGPYFFVKNATITLGASAVLTGGQVYLQGNPANARTLDITGGATIDASPLTIRSSYTLSGGTYASASVVIVSYITGSKTVFGLPGPQTLTFEGNVTYQCKAGETWECDFDDNNPDIVHEGNVTLQDDGGTWTWTKGAGKIRCTGSSDQILTTLNKALEDIEIEKDAATDKVTLVDGLQTDSFTGIEGRFDPAGQTLTIAGNCDWQLGFNFDDDTDTLNGSVWNITGTFDTVAIDLASNSSAGWELNVGGAAAAAGIGDVADCDASGGTEIDASAGPWNDGTGNANWNFGAVPAGRQRRPFASAFVAPSVWGAA